MDAAPAEPRRRAERGRGRAAIATTVASAGVPYGYTIALWSSGAMLMLTRHSDCRRRVRGGSIHVEQHDRLVDRRTVSGRWWHSSAS
jgi:hypothetical protein